MEETETASPVERGNESAGNETVPFSAAALREKLRAAIDETMTELGDQNNDVDAWRRKLTGKFEAVFSEQENHGVSQDDIAEVRTKLKQGTKKNDRALVDLHFSDGVLAKLVGIDRECGLPRDRARVAVLAALLEATKPMTPDMLSQRIRYSAKTMEGRINTLKTRRLQNTNWMITGNGTHGWAIVRR